MRGPPTCQPPLRIGYRNRTWAARHNDRMDADAWDVRYRESELVWSPGPNQFVEAELADLPPGRALDLAAGEGRNAIWLAEQGWQVTAVDFSQAGLDKGRSLRRGPARRLGVRRRDHLVRRRVLRPLRARLPPAARPTSAARPCAVRSPSLRAGRHAPARRARLAPT